MTTTLPNSLVRVEQYWRLTHRHAAFEFSIGLEMGEHDDPAVLVPMLRMLAGQAAQVGGDTWSTGASAHYHHVAQSLGVLLTEWYPNRYFFLEVGNDDEYWVQIFHPPQAEKGL